MFLKRTPSQFCSYCWILVLTNFLQSKHEEPWKSPIHVVKTQFPTGPCLLTDLLGVTFCLVMLSLGHWMPGHQVRPRTTNSPKTCRISFRAYDAAQGYGGWCRDVQTALDLTILNNTAPMKNTATHNYLLFLGISWALPAPAQLFTPPNS